MALPNHLTLEVVTPEGLLLKEDVAEVVAPGADGYFGVLPGHTPFLATLGTGEISYRRGETWNHLTSFWGFCEVLPDRVSILAETIRGFKMIVEGELDHVPEQAFFMVGPIEEVFEQAKALEK